MLDQNDLWLMEEELPVDEPADVRTYPPDRAPCPRVSPLDARVQPVVGAAYVAARSRAHAAFHAAGMSGGRSRAMTIPRESRGKM